MSAFKIPQETLNWLMEGDPAIRWQVQRDLLGEPPEVYLRERSRVANEGWGARYLALQAGDGMWGGGLYSPKYISTHYTLLTLKHIGLAARHPQALKACALLAANPLFYNVGPGFPTDDKREADICVVGMTVSMLAFFRFEDQRLHQLAEHLVANQMDDGGWNCRHWRGDTHSSFHSTCSVLEGLLAYQRAYPDTELPVAEQQAQGREFLLQHRFYQSHRTGQVVNDTMTRFPFPPRWQYNFLKGLDYFQDAGAPVDARAADAIELLLSRRDEQGRWPQYAPLSKYHFQMETASKPSRWNTLRALRVLKWWQAGNG